MIDQPTRLDGQLPKENALGKRKVNVTTTTVTKTIHARKEEDNQINSSESNSSNSSTKYWRFDEAGPTILAAKTHFLQSIPPKYRLPQSIGWNNLTEYASLPYNQWPNKLPLYEINPCIAVLPKVYQQSLHITGSSLPPVYIVVYRVTHKHNCYGGDINLQLMGGLWEPTFTEYLGMAILDQNLEILIESTFRLAPKHPVLPYVNDYRVYNLKEQLYLTAVNRIVPLYLTLSPNDTNKNNKPTASTVDASWVKLLPAFEKEKEDTKNNTTVMQPPPFSAWLRNYSACPVYHHAQDFPHKGTSKNLLYFVTRYNDAAADQNHSSNKNDIRVIHYPRSNPNDVRHVELNTPCGSQPITPFDDKQHEWYPPPSFRTIDDLLFPVSSTSSSVTRRKTEDHRNLYMRDRGSACCIVMTNPAASVKGQEVLVAVVHPKTIFPGKKLPPGVIPNTYLSRWVAMEPYAPYRIVARSGIFCLGYPTTMHDRIDQTENNNNNNNNNTSANKKNLYYNPLAMDHMSPMTFAGESFNCPRIHFVMGMVEKVDDPSRVLISYGVSDCMSRIIEISKSEIQARLWPEEANTA
jgi:hypothetical protein